jgi:hypothetical protein
MPRRALALATLTALLLAACGGDPVVPAASAGPEGEARARLEGFFDAVRAGGGARAAGFVAYRGADEARRYRDVAGYTEDADRRQVDRLVQKTAAWLALGAPSLSSPEARTKGTEAWVAWRVAFGQGTPPKRTAVFALVKTPKGWAIGDVDEVAEPAPTGR